MISFQDKATIWYMAKKWCGRREARTLLGKSSSSRIAVEHLETSVDSSEDMKLFFSEKQIIKLPHLLQLV